MRVDLFFRDAGAVKLFGPQESEVAYDVVKRRIKVCRRILGAIAEVRERTVTNPYLGRLVLIHKCGNGWNSFSVIRIINEMRFPARNNAGEEMLLVNAFEVSDALRDGGTDNVSGLFGYRVHNFRTVVAHLWGKGYHDPIYITVRENGAVPVSPLNVLGVLQEVGSFGPPHRVVNVESNGDILFFRYRK